MSDTQNKSKEEIMLENAQGDGSNKALEDYLADIKQRFKPENVNQLSTEQIQSAYELVKIIKQRTLELDLAKGQEADKAKIALNNLKEEIMIKQQIEEELKKMSLVRLSDYATFDDPSNSDMKARVNFYLTRISDNEFLVEARERNVNISKKITSIKEIDPFIKEIKADNYEGLITKTNDIKKQSQPQKPEVKKEPTKNEIIASKLGIDASEFDNTNIESAITSMTNTSFRGSSYESWSKVGYSADGVFGSFELTQLNKLRTKYTKDADFKNKVDSLSQEIKEGKKIESPKVEEKKSEQKQEVKKEDGINNLKESSVKINEKELKLPTDETVALKEILGVELKDTNSKKAIEVLTRQKTEYKTKEDWEKAGYDADGWRFDSEEFKQLNEFQTKVRNNPEAKENLLSVFSYYLNGENAVSYIRDRKILEQYKEENVFDYLSDRKNTKGAINEGQIRTVLNRCGEEPNTFLAIEKLINIGGGNIGTVSSKKDLYEKIYRNPSIKNAFIKGVDLIAGSRLDFMDYVKNGGDTSKYIAKLESGSKNLGVALDKRFEDSFSKSLSDAISKVEADKTLTPEEKQKRLASLKTLENLEEKQKLKDFFVFKSLSLFGSLVEGKEGGGGMITIGNNSENAFINKIDLEIGLFATATGDILPGVGLAISDSYDLTKTIQAHGRAGVNIYGAYILVGANKQVNFSEIENATFTNFSGQTRRLGIYGNGAVGFMGGASYGAGLYYKESKGEAIAEKRKLLETTIDLFKNIKSTSEIGTIKIPNIKEEESEIIKMDIKNMLLGMGFDSAGDDARRARIFDMMKTGKLNYFMQIATKATEEKGWTWSGLALGVQFLAGFFPIPVAGISFEKTSQTGKADKDKKFQDNLIMLANGESTTDYNATAAEIKNNLKVPVKFDADLGCFVIEGYDNATGMIKNKNGYFIKILFNSQTQKEIKIDGNKLIIGNVGAIAMTDVLTSKSLEISLILGGRDGQIEANQADNFSANSPKGWIEKGKEKTQAKQNIESNILTGFEGFIEKNIGRFNIGMSDARSKEWKIYKDFRKHLSSGDFEKARADFVAYLKVQKKHLVSGGQGLDTGSIITRLNSISDRQELSLVLAEFKDALMADLYTRGRAGSPHARKKGEVSNYDLATKEWQGIKGTNRKSAFGRMATKEFGANAEIMKNLREELVSHDKERVGWTVDKEMGKDIFGLVASYKIARDENGKVVSGGKGFDAMPPGTVSVADGEIKEIVGGNTEELYTKLFAQKEYKNHIKGVLARTIKASDNTFDTASFTDEHLKQIIINKENGIVLNGKTYRLPEAKFVFFMYGRCYNEAMGLKFGPLMAETPGEKPKYAPVNLMNNSAVESTVYGNKTREVNLGLATGGKKDEQSSNPNNNTTTPGGTEGGTTTTIPDTGGAAF